MQNDVLFYPQIGLDNPRLIKSLALLYDNIYRICPDNVIPEDHWELQALLEEGSVGKIIDPAKYAEHASNEFLDSLENWNAAALTFDEGDLTRLHIGKTDQIVREMFKDIGFKEKNDWMHIPTELASNFILFMANNIARKNNLSLCTNNLAAWTATSYFGIEGKIHDHPMHPGYDDHYIDEPFALFNMLISELTPINIGEVPADKILEFKFKRRDEILNFRQCIYDLKQEIELTIDRDISIDQIESKAKQLAAAQDDYKKSADLIKAKKWFGSTMMGIPGTIGLCKLLAIPTTTTVALASTGIVLGSLYSLASSREEVKKLNRENPASFLVELNKSFKGHFSGINTGTVGDINMSAWNSMEEYVAD